MSDLEWVRVLDCSAGIAGGYCAKLLGDGGADVVKIEPPGGDPLRSWSCRGHLPAGVDGALFRYLHHGLSDFFHRATDRASRFIRTRALLVKFFTHATHRRKRSFNVADHGS